MRFFLLSSIIFLFASIHVFAQKTNFIYTPEGKQTFTSSTEKFLVVLKENTTAAKQKNTLFNNHTFQEVKKLQSFKNTYLVSLDEKQKFSKLMASIQSEANIEFLSPEITFENGNTGFFQNKIIVKLKSLADVALLEEKAKAYQLVIDLQDDLSPHIYYLSSPDKSINKLIPIVNNLQEANLFEFVELNKIYKIEKYNTNDPELSRQWALNNTGDNVAEHANGTPNADMRVFEAWGITTGSPDITIAVLDDGIAGNHPDLRNNLVEGYDAIGEGRETNPEAINSHGTACAGLIAAEGNNGIGIAGVAYGCKLMPIRILRGDNNFVDDAGIARAMTWAWQNGADILSNSWSGGLSNSIMNNAIEEATTRGRNGLGAIVLFATGNNNGSVNYPTSNSNVIAVGATSNCDERKRSSISCDGIGSWGSNHGTNLDVAAPSPWTATTDLVGELGRELGDYRYFGGTSAACPNAAGVVALILSVNPNLTQLEARNVLESTCDKVGGYTYRNNVAGQPNGSWSTDLGYGRVNAFEAVKRALELASEPEATSECNLVINGDFENNTSDWVAWGCNLSTTNGALAIGSIRASANPWDMGVQQANLTITQGQSYELTFKAQSSFNRVMDVKVGLGAAPYTGYFYQSINLTPQLQSFSFSFTMESPTTTNGAVEFFVADNANPITIDDVSLVLTTCQADDSDNASTDLSGEYRLRNVWRNKYLHQGYDYDNSPVYTHDLREDWDSQIWEVKKGEEEGVYRLQCKWAERYLSINAVENETATTTYPLNTVWWSQMWYLEHQGNNTFRIKNRWSGRYLNANHWEAVEIYDGRQDWESQLWVLEPTDRQAIISPVTTANRLANPNASSKPLEVYEYLNAFQEADDINLLTSSNPTALKIDSATTQQNNLTVYPNPATENAILSLQEEVPIVGVQLVDATGKQMSVDWLQTASNTYQISWKKIPSGLYFIQVRTAQEAYSSKILIR